VTFVPISSSRDFSTLNISETTRDRAIVAIERQQEVICALSHGDISNDLNPVFKVTAFLKSNIVKTAHLKDKVTIAQ